MNASPVDESYRSFAVLAFILTALHFILPFVKAAPSCSDQFAVTAPSAILIWLGTIYSLSYLTWISRTKPEDFFLLGNRNGSASQVNRVSRYKTREDARFMALFWIGSAAVALLVNDLLLSAPYGDNPKHLPWSLISPAVTHTWLWVLWSTMASLAAAFFARALGHVLSMGNQAGVEDAAIVFRRIESAKANIKLA